MDLSEAKEIVKSFEGKTFQEIVQMKKNVSEAIRMITEVSLTDEEARKLERLVPSELQVCGLYPHVMKVFSHLMPESLKFSYSDMIVSKAQNALTRVQSFVIGVARPKMAPNMSFDPIVKKDGDTLTLFGVGSLLGSSTLCIEESQCTVYYFPEGKTLSQMKEDPIKFNEWWNTTVK